MSLSDNTLNGEDTFKIRLESSRNSQRVIFNVTPELSESRTVNYKSMDPVHMPGQITVWQSTANRNFNLGSITVISRSKTEASKNLDRINLLRSWTMPHFGKQENTLIYGPLGAPPDVLLLSAYSNKKSQENIYRVPTVITSLSINYPKDIDYIEAVGKGKIPFPTVMAIEISLMEVHSPKEFATFSLSKYRSGKLTNF